MDKSQLQALGAGCFPAHLGILVVACAGDPAPSVHLAFEVRPELMAPHGYLHGGAVVALADSAAGYGCLANLPEGATGFTTVEMKSNHLGTAREGTVECIAQPVHRGRSTQVWDAVVTHRQTGRTLALFRCTQMLLYPASAPAVAEA
jgi:1,4-dihydroxy-2-naphthoyl-CoA hydrolase